MLTSVQRGLAAALVAASLPVVAASHSATVLASTTLETAKDTGSIRLGFANETPFSYATTDGAMAGADVDVLTRILTDMGIGDIDGRLTTFCSLIPGLRARRFDLIASAVYIKPDRCKQVAFGEPMYVLGDTVVVPAGNPKGIHSYRDVAADPALTLGYPTGGTGVSENAKAMGVRDDQLIGFNDGPSAFAAVKAGRIDGYATTALIGETQLRALGDPALERAAPFEQPVKDGKPLYGIASFAVRLEDQDLLAAMNDRLEALKASPEYLAIVGKYGLTEAEIPKGITTAEICTD